MRNRSPIVAYDAARSSVDSFLLAYHVPLLDATVKLQIQSDLELNRSIPAKSPSNGMDIMLMRFISATTAGLLFLTFYASAASPDFERLKTDAEKQYAEGWSALAHETYAKAQVADLPAPDKRRLISASPTRSGVRKPPRRRRTPPNSTAPVMNSKSSSATSSAPKIRIASGPKCEESLGDYFWTRRNSHNWGEAWPHYQKALDWWAGAADIELARQRYLKIVWTMARPPQHGSGVLLLWRITATTSRCDVLENALKIAQTDNDKAHAHYLIAMTLRKQGGDGSNASVCRRNSRARSSLAEARDWYDDALYNYARMDAEPGPRHSAQERRLDAGTGLPKALELFRRFVKEFQKGETRYCEQAQQQIQNITEPQS